MRRSAPVASRRGPNRVPAALAAALLLAAPALAEVRPVELEWSQQFYGVGELAILEVCGDPGTVVFLGIDHQPGPAQFPLVGTIGLGMSADFLVRNVGTIPPNGKLFFDCSVECSMVSFGSTMYVQAFSIDPGTGIPCLSNTATTVFLDTDGCESSLIK